MRYWLCQMADIINGNWYCKMPETSHFEMPKFSNFKSSSSNNKSIVLPKLHKCVEGWTVEVYQKLLPNPCHRWKREWTNGRVIAAFRDYQRKRWSWTCRGVSRPHVILTAHMFTARAVHRRFMEHWRLVDSINRVCLGDPSLRSPIAPSFCSIRC